MCFAGTQQLSAQSVLSASLNVVISGEGEDASSSKIHFTCTVVVSKLFA